MEYLFKFHDGLLRRLVSIFGDLQQCPVQQRGFILPYTTVILHILVTLWL